MEDIGNLFEIIIAVFTIYKFIKPQKKRKNKISQNKNGL